MDMDKLIGEFAEKMKLIHLFQRVSANMVEKEVESLVKLDEKFKDNPDKETLLSSYHNFGFVGLQSGETYFFGQSRLSPQERQYYALLTKNKQYQWLLAEAFEAFQDFIWKAYALIGMVDNDFWPLADFGNVTWSALPDKSFEWFYERAKKKDLRDIIKLFQQKRQILASLERDNALKRDLRVYLSLIEKIRHIIVHRGGVVRDREEFTKSVLKPIGLYNDGNVDPDVRNVVYSTFGQGDLSNTIVVLEVAHSQVPILQVNRFVRLAECLIGYAHAVSQHLIPANAA